MTQPRDFLQRHLRVVVLGSDDNDNSFVCRLLTAHRMVNDEHGQSVVHFTQASQSHILPLVGAHAAIIVFRVDILDGWTSWIRQCELFGVPNDAILLLPWTGHAPSASFPLLHYPKSHPTSNKHAVIVRSAKVVHSIMLHPIITYLDTVAARCVDIVTTPLFVHVSKKELYMPPVDSETRDVKNNENEDEDDELFMTSSKLMSCSIM